MLGWALGYLAVVIVVAIGFASLQGDRAQPAAASHTARAAPAERSGADERSEWNDDEALEYVVDADPSGHYLIEAVVNGAPVTFLVDTGASEVVLTLADARRVGLQPQTLAFTQRFATANGEVRGAPVVLREIRIGQFRLFDVAASVNEAPLGVSLLGMSFLEQLSSYEVERGRLILRW